MHQLAAISSMSQQPTHHVHEDDVESDFPHGATYRFFAVVYNDTQAAKAYQDGLEYFGRDRICGRILLITKTPHMTQKVEVSLSSAIRQSTVFSLLCGEDAALPPASSPGSEGKAIILDVGDETDDAGVCSV